MNSKKANLGSAQAQVGSAALRAPLEVIWCLLSCLCSAPGGSRSQGKGIPWSIHSAQGPGQSSLEDSQPKEMDVNFSSAEKNPQELKREKQSPPPASGDAAQRRKNRTGAGHDSTKL